MNANKNTNAKYKQVKNNLLLSGSMTNRSRVEKSLYFFTKE